MFYEQLNALCKENKMTITAFTTQVLELSSSKVTAWKSGSIPKYRTLEKIAKYFNVTIGELFDGKNENLSKNEREMLNLFRNLSEREQIKEIGRLESFKKEDAVADIEEGKYCG